MSVGTKATRGVAWNMVTAIGTRAIGLVGTLVLTRFIAPGEYGEVTVASICVMSAMMLTNFSLGQYIIAKKATPDETFHAAVAHITLGACAVLAVLVLRTSLGAWFDAPGMGRFVPGFALAMLINCVGYVPERTLVRGLRFRSVAVTRAMGEITFTAIALASAPWFGGMAIVFGNVARSAQVTAMFIRSADAAEWLRPVRLQGGIFARLFKYCWPFSISGMADMASGRWDNLLISRYFGPELAGQYNLAYNLAVTPCLVGENISDVLMPSFAQLDAAKRRPALLRAARVTAILVFPLAVGLGVVAPTAVHALFDPRWVQVAPMLAILCSISVALPIGGVIVSFLQAQQRPRPIMALNLVKTAMVLGAIVAAGRYGPLWTSTAVGAVFVLHMLITLTVASVLERVSMLDYLRGLAPPMVACGVIAAAVLAQRALLRHIGIDAGWISLPAEIVVGAIAYVATLFVVARPTVDDLLAQLHRLLARRHLAE